MIRNLTDTFNMRVQLRQLCGALRDLGDHGVMKPPDKAGLDSIDEDYRGVNIDKNEHYKADPTGNRTGNGPGPQLRETIERVCVDAENLIQPSNIQRKITTSLADLQEKLDNMRGAVMMCYPMGLPDYDTVKLTLDGLDGMEGTQAGSEVLDPSTSELWVASRVFDRNTKVSDRLGKNEKTKVIGKLQKPGAGAPSREAVVNEDERKAMMAFYFKKQEEQKALAENSEDDYLNSVWADPKALQRNMRGMGSGLKAPGIL
jgi:cilia- and flagella-associated protein 298